jgi:DNA-directed RNA polymerase subunit M
MVPKKDGGKTLYRCPKCGHEEVAGQQSVKITTTVKHSIKEKTLVLESDVPPTGAQITKGILQVYQVWKSMA